MNCVASGIRCSLGPFSTLDPGIESSSPKELFNSDKNDKDAQNALITVTSFFSKSRVFFLVRLRFSLLMNNSFLTLL